MRPDMFPPDVIAALSRLHNDVPAHSFYHTQRMVKESFGCDLEEIFSEFEPEPVASGTVAQVHRAKLRPEYAEKANLKARNGEWVEHVAVKVRHPHVLDETWLDVDLIFAFMNASRIMVVPFDQQEFMTMLTKQVDFHWEAALPVEALLSQTVLVESWADGRTVSEIFSKVGFNFEEVKESAEGLGNKIKQLPKIFSDDLKQKKKELAMTVFDMNLKMFLRDNLVHGDLHGGNVLYDE
eukprot:CAMPEP_0114571588 /NCGR_PEP_ID=MMETSP0114-20121206/17821_1 /TAXON_ID=31324 /ORGANISM="Goniomonas sp, Strain m" /LENGTH=237 /DNA_ID=CAMNT_0001758707 /DNA_START=179 /DNA_END=888 /DNA_ORIENTATION=-